MVDYQVEDVRLLKEELEPMILAHYKEIALYQESIKLAPDWARYFQLEEMGILKILTARQEGTLIGYYIQLINPNLHYSLDNFAVCDIVYLGKEYRGGKHSVELFKQAEKVAKDNGASVMTMHFKTYLPFDNLMVNLGWDYSERLYTKLIK